MKRALSILALASLVACGGGGSGGGSGGGFMVAAAPAAEPAPVHPVEPVAVKTPINPNCVFVSGNHLSCDLFASDEAIGVGVAPGVYVTFTNKTGTHLQINEVSAITGEQQYWSEYCVHLDSFLTGQTEPGNGEVSCMTKNPGEGYPVVRWGTNGLAVAPGGVIYVNSHTEPSAINHTYSLMVSNQTSGIHSWRQPQMDAVIPCNGEGSTAWTPWQNTTGRDVQVIGASVYSVSGSVDPNTISGPACVYVIGTDGMTKAKNCDSSLRTRGDVTFQQVLTVAPWEYVGAQAVNSCMAPNTWDWAAFLKVQS